MSFEQKEWKNRLSENPTRRTLTPVDGSSPMVVDVTRNEGTIMQQGDPFNADNMNDLERRIAEGIGGGEDIIAPTEQEISENAYVVGQKLIFDGVLYNVISPIAVGNSLVPGVNIQVTTVSEMLSVLEDELTANNTRIYMDYQNGKYGYNTDPERGADTFFPFRGTRDRELVGSYTGNATINIASYNDYDMENWSVVVTGASSSLYKHGDSSSHFHGSASCGFSYSISGTNLIVSAHGYTERNEYNLSCDISYSVYHLL